MAVVNTKSTMITNADATPLVINSPIIDKGNLFESIGSVEVAAADDDTSVFRMVRLPSGARISQILFANDAITGGTGYDFGLYRSAKDDGAVVDDDLFLSGVDFSSARAQWTDLMFESASFDHADVENKLWEHLSLSEDPFFDYDLCFTGDTVGTGAGTLTVMVRWVI